MATNERNTWMTWALGAILTVTVGTTTAVYSSIDKRVTNNETAIVELGKQVTDPQVLINIALLQREMELTKQSTSRIEVRQEAFDRKMSIFLNMYGQNSAQYKEAVREYREFVNEMRQKGSK